MIRILTILSHCNVYLHLSYYCYWLCDLGKISLMFSFFIYKLVCLVYQLWSISEVLVSWG